MRQRPWPRALPAGMAVRPDQRDDRDRRERVPPVRRAWRGGAADACALRSRPWRRGRLGGSGEIVGEVVPVEVRGGAGARRRRERKGRPRRLHPGVAGQAAPDHEGRDGHRGRLGRSKNDAAAACLVVAEDKLDELGLEPMAFLAGLDRGRVRARHDGPGAGAGRGQAVRAARARLRRHGPDRAERGVRGPGAGRAAGLGHQARRTRQPAERERLGHLPRPPDRRDRRPHPDHDAARTEAPRRPVRAGDDVRRRRPGRRGRLRGPASARPAFDIREPAPLANPWNVGDGGPVASV